MKKIKEKVNLMIIKAKILLEQKEGGGILEEMGITWGQIALVVTVLSVIYVAYNGVFESIIAKLESVFK